MTGNPPFCDPITDNMPGTGGFWEAVGVGRSKSSKGFTTESLRMEKIVWGGAAVTPRWSGQACHPHGYRTGCNTGGQKNPDPGEGKEQLSSRIFTVHSIHQTNRDVPPRTGLVCADRPIYLGVKSQLWKNGDSGEGR